MKKINYNLISKYRKTLMGLSIISIIVFHFAYDVGIHKSHYTLFWKLYKTIIGSSAITLAAKQVVTLAKSLPIAGDIVNGTVAGAFVLALGEGVIAVSEGIYTGKIDPKQTDKIGEVIGENIKDNPIIKATMDYFEKNSDKISEKTSKEVFNEIKKSVNKTKK